MAREKPQAQEETLVWHLKRLEQFKYVMLGRLLDHNGNHICFTCELPWRDNAPRISCVPPGEYTLRRGRSVKWGRVVYLKDVPDRGPIRFTKGAYTLDIGGAIVVSNNVEFRENDPLLRDGGLALANVHFYLPRRKPCKLKITPPFDSVPAGPLYGTETWFIGKRPELSIG